MAASMSDKELSRLEMRCALDHQRLAAAVSLVPREN
jgi:hypothetical protein